MAKLSVLHSVALWKINIDLVQDDMEFAEAIAATIRKPFGDIPATITNLAYKNKKLFQSISEHSQLFTTFNEVPMHTNGVTSILYVKPLCVWAIHYHAKAAESAVKFNLKRRSVGNLTIMHYPEDEYFDLDPEQDKKLIEFLDISIPGYASRSVSIRIKL